MKKEPPTSGIIGAAVGLGTLAYGAYNTINNNNKANAIQNSLKTPVDQIPQEFYTNREIARQMAQIGTPQQQYNNARENINQNQASGIAAAQNGNNPGGAITSIVRGGNKAVATLDAGDAAARENNQRFFIQENGALGTRKDQQEQANVFDPYTRDFNQIQAYRGAAQTTQNNTVNAGLGLAGIAAQYASKNPSTPAANNPNIDVQNLQIPQQYWPQGGGAVDPATGLPYQQTRGQFNSYAGGFQ